MESTTSLNNIPNADESSAGIFSDLSIIDFLNLIKIKWLWFVISLIICLGLGAFYVSRSPRVYSGSASVLIKDPYYGKSTTGIDISDLGVISGRSNLDNEIAAFTSLDLMMKVVTDLDLNNQYIVKSGFRKQVLFEESPVTVTFPDEMNDEANYSFKFIAHKNGDVQLSDFVKSVNGATSEYDNVINARTGTRVKTPIGTITLTRSSWTGSDKYIDKEIEFKHSTIRSAANTLAASVKVKASTQDGTIIGLSATASSPKMSEAILSEVIKEYNNFWIEDKHAVSEATSNFINKRLAVIEQELGNVDSDISSYKSSNLTPDLGEASRLIMEQSASLQNKMLEISNQISIAEFIRAELSRDNITEPLPTNIGLENSGVERQITEYNELVLYRNRLLTSVGENNPISIEKANALRAMKANILRSSGNLVSSLRTQLRGLQTQDSNYDSRLASSPGQAKYLLSAERKQKVQETLYLFLLEKREENEIAQSFTTYNTQIVESPYCSTKPVSPKTRIIMIVAFILGLIIPAVIIYLKMALSTKVHSKSDIDSLTIPFMGEIPENDASDYRGNRLMRIFKSRAKQYDMAPARKIVVKHGNNNIINEAFRVLRTNLEFVTTEHKGGLVTMLSSSYPGSGKTFISTNLGAVIAVKGKKALLMDMDLRKGTLSKLVHSPREGLSQLLAKNGNIENSIVRNVDGIEGLDMLPSGTLPPNPAELLGTKRVGEIIDALREEYDYIIIDCPPIDVVADAQLVAPYVDQTLFVMRAGLFDKRLIPLLKKYYESKRFNNLAIILNGTQSSGIYGYKQYGRYGYRSRSTY